MVQDCLLRVLHRDGSTISEDALKAPEVVPWCRDFSQLPRLDRNTSESKDTSLHVEGKNHVTV